MITTISLFEHKPFFWVGGGGGGGGGLVRVLYDTCTNVHTGYNAHMCTLYFTPHIAGGGGGGGGGTHLVLTVLT